jgi:hypothetical protein
MDILQLRKGLLWLGMSIESLNQLRFNLPMHLKTYVETGSKQAIECVLNSHLWVYFET